MPLKKWNKISESTFKQNAHWSYKIDKFNINGGNQLEYHYVHTNGSTMVIPITSDGKILMVNQYRYLNQMESLEFPCGSVEDGLSFEENAQKELREETGFSAAKIIKTGFFAPYTGASDELCTVFIASELTENPLPADITEDFELYSFTFDEIKSMIAQQIIWDGLTLAAWSFSQKIIKDNYL